MTTFHRRPRRPHRLAGARASLAALACALGAAALPALAASPPQVKAPAATPPPAAGDLAAWCRGVVARIPTTRLPECQASGLQRGDARSVRGVPLWTLDLPPPTATVRPVSSAPPLRVLVLGGIHGDEAAAVSLVFDWMERARSATPPRVHWRFTPLVNPDGLLRRPSTRVNANGVDLNRNFPTRDWAREAPKWWAERTKKDPRRFPGRKPLSEPESQWVQRQIEQWQPNLIVSVHAPYGVLDFDGPPPPPYKVGSLILDQVGIFPGSLGNYGGVVRGVPVVTLELHNAQRFSPADGLAMWADLNAWITDRLLPPGR